ncbi:SRPBCC family protein [Rhizobium sp. SL42]|uniref:SRPBCC family protein n=1 Tax=Rhizobium sp. SL42 TaxID=2806346 RepID=UPI001F184D92|nr:SRPBCC family protein [Rhizobium sp. SL42]UJW74666.1 SRPBCC family protein [Rhizobium sp. SL42]
MPHTIRLHRVLKAAPEKVYRAFMDADAQCKWIPPYGFVAKIHHFEPKVGGTFRMSFTNFTTQQSHSFGGTYLELVPGKLIRYNDVFDDPNLPGEMNVTVELTEVFCGTDIKITQAGVPEVIPEAACYLGWQESLAQLALLVEPDIQQEG